MRISYYVACSLDNYIAARDGGLGWLDAVEREGEDYGYSEFLSSVDGLLMGRSTFDVTRGFGPWPYEDKACWVFSHRDIEEPPANVVGTDAEPLAVVERAVKGGLRHLWLVGGGVLATTFRAQGLVTDYIVSLVPVVLGQGIPLFEPGGEMERLELVESESYPSGLVQLRYRLPG